jgi:uncharacterized protein (DUF3084 family)
VILLALSKTAAAESNFWDVLQKQVTEDEMKSFILYVQELEAENTALQNKISVLEESLAETRQRVIKLEELVETRDGEIKLLESENLMLRQQVTEYKFLYENTRPSALDKAATIGLGAGVAAFLCFLVQIAD